METVVRIGDLVFPVKVYESPGMVTIEVLWPVGTEPDPGLSPALMVRARTEKNAWKKVYQWMQTEATQLEH